jgi:hypothetical protein
MLNDPVHVLLWRDLAIFLMFGALLGVSLGLLLIFKPQYLERCSKAGNRWISTRHISQWLDRSISIEHWFYRHHRAVGFAIVLGAAYIFIYFGFQFDRAYTLLRWSQKLPLPAQQLNGLLNALVLGGLIGGAVALIAGLFLWFRPSLLRGVEEQSNRWVSSRRATKILDVPHDQVDIFVARHAQKAGWLLLLASIYLFFTLFRLLV